MNTLITPDHIGHEALAWHLPDRNTLFRSINRDMDDEEWRIHRFDHDREVWETWVIAPSDANDIIVALSHAKNLIDSIKKRVDRQ